MGSSIDKEKSKLVELLWPKVEVVQSPVVVLSSIRDDKIRKFQKTKNKTINYVEVYMVIILKKQKQQNENVRSKIR